MNVLRTRIQLQETNIIIYSNNNEYVQLHVAIEQHMTPNYKLIYFMLTCISTSSKPLVFVQESTKILNAFIIT